MNEPVIEIAGQRPEVPAAAPDPLPAVTTWARRCVDAAEQLADLNSRALHVALDEQRAIAQEAASQPSWLNLWRLQTGYALAATTKSAAYLRHVSEIALGAYVDAVADTERCIKESYLSATSMLENRATRATSLIVEAEEIAEPVKPAGPILDAHGNAASS